MNNFFSGFIKKINKTSYYHEKINKMLNLFVKAFRIIDDDKSDLLTNSSSDNLNSIKEEPPVGDDFGASKRSLTTVLTQLSYYHNRIIA